MHLRYDPIADALMSGKSNINEVSRRDQHIIRERMRIICANWDFQRDYRICLPPSLPPLRFFNKESRLTTRFAVRHVNVELVRPPAGHGLVAIANRMFGRVKARRVLDLSAVRVPPKPAQKPAAPQAKPFWESGDDFVRALVKRGYRTLGAGAFSSVLAKGNSKRVIKVNRGNADGWLDYVLWAAEKGHMGKLAPMVYSFRRFNEGTKNEFYVAVMERMEDTVSNASYGNPRLIDLYEHLSSGMTNRHGSERDALRADDMQPGSLRFAIEFKLHFSGGLDLHSGNFMVRKDGSMACTDPISGDPSGTAPSRWRHSSVRLAA